MSGARWAALRALLIGGVLAAQCADAMPLPTLRPQHLKTAIGQDELRRWMAALHALGLSVTEEELVAGGLAVGAQARVFREWLVQPLTPVKRLTGTGQSWGLFAYPDPHAGRLVIETRTTDGRAEEGWQERFRAPWGSGDRLGRRMRYRRIRGVYDDAGDQQSPRPLYGRFVDWVARDLLEAEPDVVAVRVRLDLVAVKLPGEGAEPPEVRRHVRVRTRAALLEGGE